MSVYESEADPVELDEASEAPAMPPRRTMRDLDDIPRTDHNDGPGSAFMWTGRMR